MAETLQYTDNGDGTVTLDNSPVPTEVTIGRILWTQMVDGELPWATVTQDESSRQHLAITATNVTATFDWEATLPGRTTLLSVATWVEV